MPLTIVSFATYLSAVGTRWRDQDWDTYKFVKAIKGKPFKYSAQVPVVGTQHFLNQSNANAVWRETDRSNHLCAGSVASHSSRAGGVLFPSTTRDVNESNERVAGGMIRRAALIRSAHRADTLHSR